MMMKSTLRSFRGKSPQIAEQVWVDTTAVIIGDVHIAADCSIWPYAVIRGDMHQIRIGPRSSIQDGSVLHITHASAFNPDGFALTLGEEVTVGHKAILHGCTIGNRVLIGMGATVMDGAYIEDEVVLGAGSLVPPGKRLESGYLYVGSPVKKIRALTAQEKSYFSYTAANYVKLKDEYLTESK